MVITTQQLLEKFKNFSDPKGKISREVKNGNLIPITQGLYETNQKVEGAKLAQFIYGPSYLSFDYALARHDLIPETTFKTYTCASYNKRKIKVYDNFFGTYIYNDVPKDLFFYGIDLFEKDGYSYQMATKEKALCDKIYLTKPVSSLKAFKNLIFEDLRIDESKFLELDREFIFKIAPLYGKRNLGWLTKLLKED